MSVLHNPHFDWVVVHVGSSFPETVINKVLTCGLKDFCNSEQSTQVKNIYLCQEKNILIVTISISLKLQTPKLNSVVGILGHLAGTHFTELKNALVNLFQVIYFCSLLIALLYTKTFIYLYYLIYLQWSLEETNDDKNTLMQKVATVPYLLHLASLSPVLLKALSADTLQSCLYSNNPSTYYLVIFRDNVFVCFHKFQ